MKLKAIFLALATLLSVGAYAKIQHDQQLNVYDSPSEHAKVLTMLDPSKGITIVESDWVRIRDPKSGKLGWVKRNDLQKLLHSSISFTHFSTSDTIDDAHPHGYRIVEYSTSQPSRAEVRSLMEKSMQQRRAMQKEFARSMRDFDDLFDSFHRDLARLDTTH